MILTDESKAAMFKCDIPDYMHGGIVRWYENGLPPGDFLTAVIDNDLKEAVGRADDRNIHCIKNYIMWFYNHAPSGTWGFEGAVDLYCKRFKEARETESV